MTIKERGKMNEQNVNTQPVVQANKRPILVTIIGIYGILNFAAFLFLMFATFFLESSPGYQYFLLMLVLGTTAKSGLIIGSIISLITSGAAIGLLAMKKSFLYIFMVVSVLSLAYSLFKILSVTNSTPQIWLSSLIVPVLVLGYLWSIRKQFN